MFVWFNNRFGRKDNQTTRSNGLIVSNFVKNHKKFVFLEKLT